MKQMGRSKRCYRTGSSNTARPVIPRALWNLSLILRDIAASKTRKSAPEVPSQEGDKDGRPKGARMGQKPRSSAL